VHRGRTGRAGVGRGVSGCDGVSPRRLFMRVRSGRGSNGVAGARRGGSGRDGVDRGPSRQSPPRAAPCPVGAPRPVHSSGCGITMIRIRGNTRNRSILRIRRSIRLCCGIPTLRILSLCCRILSWSSWSHGFFGARPFLQVVGAHPPLLAAVCPPLLGALRRQLALRRSLRLSLRPLSLRLLANGFLPAVGGRLRC
jgi:hypothetical protein